MGREIKFRVWNTLSKEMTFFDTPYFTCIKEPVVGFQNCTWKRIMIGGYTEAMQFTCLHDKSGKEIYEGDIVRATKPYYRHNCIGVCEYHGLAFGFWGKQENGSQWMDTITSSIYEFSGKIPNVEVIGNLYENPELLKGMK